LHSPPRAALRSALGFQAASDASFIHCKKLRCALKNALIMRFELLILLHYLEWADLALGGRSSANAGIAINTGSNEVSRRFALLRRGGLRPGFNFLKPQVPKRIVSDNMLGRIKPSL
jgi:hypothetical protein